MSDSDSGGRFAAAARNEWLWLAAAVVLVLIAYHTEPMFYGNQATKFLFGMKWAGVGHLARDWNANTRYGLPVFGALIYLFFASGAPWLVYVVHACLIALFAVAAHAIARTRRGADHLREMLRFDRFSLIFFAAFIVLNLGFPARIWYGLAHQSAIDPVLETASFGVLFFPAVALYLAGRRVPAIALTIPTAAIHPGYILPSTILVAAFVFSDWRNRNRLPTAYWLTIAAALVTFAVHAVYLRIHFMPTSAEMSERANTIITEMRIPEITVVRQWLFTAGTAIKVPIILLGIWLSRRQAIGRILLFGFCAISLLTVAQVASGSHLFALIEPWRASIWIAPMALIVLISCLANWLERRVLPNVAGMGKVALLAVLFTPAAAGIVYGAYHKLRDYPRRLPAYEAYLKQTANDDTLILAPTDLSMLRLDVEAPVYVTVKTHPYQDYEVLQWYRRLQRVDLLYKPKTIDCGALEALAREARLTEMVVVQPDQNVSCSFARLSYRDRDARIYAFKF